MSRMVFLIFFLGCNVLPRFGRAQEDQRIMVEESAEVFLEEYSDTFQENFFEALKQKGIQNYDKAINYLLECKKAQPDNDVVAYELAKNYLLDKKSIQAQEYAIEALNSRPENYWYLNTLVGVLKNNGTIETIKGRIPWNDNTLKENLAQIYFKKGAYEASLAVTNDLPKTRSVLELQQKLKDSIKAKKQNVKSTSFTVETNDRTGTTDVVQYKTRIEGLMRSENLTPVLVQVTTEALDTYPSQPYFYYTNGYALNRMNKNKQAIEVLEAALDYIINDISLRNKVYKELSDAYNAINNPSKANMYLSKIIQGF